jgi:hypothetical protein
MIAVLGNVVNLSAKFWATLVNIMIAVLGNVVNLSAKFWRCSGRAIL